MGSFSSESAIRQRTSEHLVAFADPVCHKRDQLTEIYEQVMDLYSKAVEAYTFARTIGKVGECREHADDVELRQMAAVIWKTALDQHRAEHGC